MISSKESNTLLGTRVVCGASAPTGAPAGANYEDGEPKARTTAMRVGKRAYRRALKRAEQFGSTVYKGRRIRAGVPEVYKPDLRPAVKSSSKSPGLAIATWNCSGLSQELFLEFQVWLRTKPDILVFTLQETHWSMTSEWSTEEWYIVHSSAAKPKQGGVMIGIRKQAVVQNSYSWAAVVPGRLLHWRGQLHKQQFDILALYINKRCLTTMRSKSRSLCNSANRYGGRWTRPLPPCPTVPR